MKVRYNTPNTKTLQFTHIQGKWAMAMFWTVAGSDPNST